jgi:hypothetical protein
VHVSAFGEAMYLFNLYFIINKLAKHTSARLVATPLSEVHHVHQVHPRSQVICFTKVLKRCMHET